MELNFPPLPSSSYQPGGAAFLRPCSPPALPPPPASTLSPSTPDHPDSLPEPVPLPNPSVNFMILDWRKIKTGILKRFRVGNLPILQIHQGGHRLGWPSVCLFLVNFGGKISNRGGKISNQGGKISNRGGKISNRGGWISNRGGKISNQW